MADYWDSVYGSTATNNTPEASPFARHCATFVEEALAGGGTLYEAGCGTGRDALFFSQTLPEGAMIMAADFSAETVARLTEKHASTNAPSFVVRDFTRLDPAWGGDDVPIEGLSAIYSRFTLHSVDADGERRFLAWAAAALHTGGVIMVEARSVKDDLYGKGEPDPAGDPDAWVGGGVASRGAHYRRFLRLDQVISSLQALDFDVVEQGESAGWARWGDADPVVVRVVAKKK